MKQSTVIDQAEDEDKANENVEELAHSRDQFLRISLVEALLHLVLVAKAQKSILNADHKDHARKQNYPIGEQEALKTRKASE